MALMSVSSVPSVDETVSVGLTCTVVVVASVVSAAASVSLTEDSSAAEDSGLLLSLLCLPHPVNAEPARTPASSSAVSFFHDFIMLFLSKKTTDAKRIQHPPFFFRTFRLLQKI